MRSRLQIQMRRVLYDGLRDFPAAALHITCLGAGGSAIRLLQMLIVRSQWPKEVIP
jgi:hypothetical protein